MTHPNTKPVSFPSLTPYVKINWSQFTDFTANWKSRTLLERKSHRVKSLGPHARECLLQPRQQIYKGKNWNLNLTKIML
jgi:hypothetical protein